MIWYHHSSVINWIVNLFQKCFMISHQHNISTKINSILFVIVLIIMFQSVSKCFKVYQSVSFLNNGIIIIDWQLSKHVDTEIFVFQVATWNSQLFQLHLSKCLYFKSIMIQIIILLWHDIILSQFVYVKLMHTING